jgi:S-methylmethionine-dependent homocysteine/selenocysteine methylase
MPLHRDDLPQLGDRPLLSDSGLETDLIFNKGWDLPGFASFPLLESDEGRSTLQAYYREHVAVAAEHGLGFVFETVTWRSNPEWGARLGYTQDRLDHLDREAVDLVEGIRDTSPEVAGPMVISGLLGPRGDGYVVDQAMTVAQARDYHSHQVRVLAGTECDLISVLTLNYADEGIGVALAARDAEIPVALSFTVETNGRLPDGTTLQDTIKAVDDATDGYVAYYGVNCAHPDHVQADIDPDADWVSRVSWVRANASRLSHAELDEAVELDPGDPVELGHDYARLRAALPGLTVFGGCCGTDVRHIREIASSVAPG